MTLKTTEAWEMTEWLHPDPELANICVDCPHCHREEFFIVFRKQFQTIVQCQSSNPFDHRMIYVVDLAEIVVP